MPDPRATRGRLLRLLAATGGILAVASVARADAPAGQYYFFNRGSLTILDQRTGLRWQRSAPTGTMSFVDAATYCGTLSLDLETTGWRVPSYKELMTIVDESPSVEYSTGQPEDEWMDPNAFFLEPVGPYWTSSMFPADPGSAYAVDFRTGVPSSADTVGTLLVRCVH